MKAIIKVLVMLLFMSALLFFVSCQSNWEKRDDLAICHSIESFDIRIAVVKDCGGPTIIVCKNYHKTLPDNAKFEVIFDNGESITFQVVDYRYYELVKDSCDGFYGIDDGNLSVIIENNAKFYYAVCRNKKCIITSTLFENTNSYTFNIEGLNRVF